MEESPDSKLAREIMDVDLGSIGIQHEELSVNVQKSLLEQANALAMTAPKSSRASGSKQSPKKKGKKNKHERKDSPAFGKVRVGVFTKAAYIQAWVEEESKWSCIWHCSRVACERVGVDIEDVTKQVTYIVNPWMGFAFIVGLYKIYGRPWELYFNVKQQAS